jgi:hypothetical protein
MKYTSYFSRRFNQPSPDAQKRQPEEYDRIVISTLLNATWTTPSALSMAKTHIYRH